MPRLVIHPGSPAAREFQLRAGVNSIGRGADNDIQIPDGSISGRHCQVMVTETAVLLRDLGSTNGTFVNGTQIIEAALENAERVRFGDVELTFYAELAPAGATSVQPPAAVAEAAVALARPGLARTTATLPSASIPGQPGPVEVGAQYCRFHPKMPARYLCEHCQHFFCDACVATRSAGGVPHKFCRHCGAECVPVLVQFAPTVEKGFFARIPGAFAYPLRGMGVLIVIVAIVLVALLKLGEAAIEYRTLRMIMFGIIMEIFVGGYLFTFLQAIIHSTEAGDRELPDLPGIANFLDDVVVPFGRLLALTLICFGVATGLVIWLAVDRQPMVAPALLIATGLGYLYFPMAFLAVATLDSLGGANPLVVMPSMLRAPAEYFTALLVLASVFVVQIGGRLLLNSLFPEGWTIHSMGGLGAMLGLMAFLSFLSLYLLIVAVHMLGLIYVTKREQLGWLER